MIFAVKLQLKQYLGKKNLKIMLISFLVAGARRTRTQALFWQIPIENHQECCPEGNFETGLLKYSEIFLIVKCTTALGINFTNS